MQLATYRIIQESLTNVVRHAGPAKVKVRMTYDDADMRVEIDDDGTGPANDGATIGAGNGIAGMRERATALGGELSAGFRRDGGFSVVAVSRSGPGRDPRAPGRRPEPGPSRF